MLLLWLLFPLLWLRERDDGRYRWPLPVSAEVEMLVGSGSTGKKLALHMDSMQLDRVKAWGRRRDYRNIVTDANIVYHPK